MKKKIAAIGLFVSGAAAIAIACATAEQPLSCDPQAGVESVLCNGACVNLTNDNSNCGACGTPCTSGQFCSGGKCGASCGASTTNCSGVCVDTQNDENNCGACAKKCSGACVAGKCGGSDAGEAGLVCTNGTTSCPSDGGAACVNTQTDDANCGACGAPCTSNEMCIAGKCTLTCDAATSLCEPDASAQYCADFTSDNENCGGCGDACEAGTCQGSQCVVTSTAVEIFPPSGTNEDPGNASVWSARYYTVTFAQAQTIVGIEWRANIATADSMYAEIWNPNTQASLAKGSTVNGTGSETFNKSNITYALQASTPYLLGIYMSNANTVFPRKDGPSYPFSVTGPHGNISVTACWSSSTTNTDIFPTSVNSWGPDFKFDIQ